MSTTRKKLLDQARAWLGAAEGSALHHEIIDCYNTQSPLPRGYKVTYTDAWCATFVSACFLRCDALDILTPECGCQEMITKNKSHWVESDDYTPSPGDIIFYDWQDSGKGDNTGYADHVGIVETVKGDKMVVIEGNHQDTSARVERTVGQQYIRGYITPPYAEDTSTTTYVVSQNFARTIFSSLEDAKKIADSTKSYVYTLDGNIAYKYEESEKYYTPTTTLYMRSGAGVSNAVVCAIPKGGKCKYLGCSGNWYNIEYNGKTGWSSKKYLTEVV